MGCCLRFNFCLYWVFIGLQGLIMELQTNQFWQTHCRGTNDNEYQIYLSCADDGKGGDITNGGKPLKTYEEWLNS
jgi:hypothetical protein